MHSLVWLMLRLTPGHSSYLAAQHLLAMRAWGAFKNGPKWIVPDSTVNMQPGLITYPGFPTILKKLSDIVFMVDLEHVT